jgi:2'-5' RNA ligase
MPTIGVTIAVPEPWGSQLQAYRESISDPMASLIPPHITLLPPVDVSGPVLDGVETHLAQAAAAVAPFSVRLRGTDTFRPTSQVVFVPLVDGAESCARLEQAVRTGLLGMDLAFPYHPHVTVAHELPEATLDQATRDLADFDADFTVTAFGLYELTPAHVWRLSRTFDLAG